MRGHDASEFCVSDTKRSLEAYVIDNCLKLWNTDYDDFENKDDT